MQNAESRKTAVCKDKAKRPINFRKNLRRNDKKISCKDQQNASKIAKIDGQLSEIFRGFVCNVRKNVQRLLSVFCQNLWKNILGTFS